MRICEIVGLSISPTFQLKFNLLIHILCGHLNNLKKRCKSSGQVTGLIRCGFTTVAAYAFIRPTTALHGTDWAKISQTERKVWTV